MNASSRMRIDFGQDIDEVLEGINSMQLAACDEGLGDRNGVSADFSPAEEPVFSSEWNGSNFSFQMIGINSHPGIGKIDAQSFLALKCIGGGFLELVGR